MFYSRKLASFAKLDERNRRYAKLFGMACSYDAVVADRLVIYLFVCCHGQKYTKNGIFLTSSAFHVKICHSCHTFDRITFANRMFRSLLQKIFLRHFDLHLEEPIGGVRGANPRRVRQVRLAEWQHVSLVLRLYQSFAELCFSMNFRAGSHPISAAFWINWI